MLLGFGVNLRIANVLLARGVGAGCLLEMLRSRFQSFKAETGLLIGAMAVGFSPTLVANAMNAGGPFSTTYGAGDASPPDFTFRVVVEYFRDLQGALLGLSIACAWLLFKSAKSNETRTAAQVAAANIVINVAFLYMLHLLLSNGGSDYRRKHWSTTFEISPVQIVRSSAPDN